MRRPRASRAAPIANGARMLAPVKARPPPDEPPAEALPPVGVAPLPRSPAPLPLPLLALLPLLPARAGVGSGSAWPGTIWMVALDSPVSASPGSAKDAAVVAVNRAVSVNGARPDGVRVGHCRPWAAFGGRPVPATPKSQAGGRGCAPPP